MSDVKDSPSEPKDVKPAEPSQDVKPEAVPYGRFKEINDKLKELEAEKNLRTEADKKAKEDKMLDEKKYKELLDQRAKELEDVRAEAKKSQEIAAKFQEQQEKIRGEALSKIPDEELRALAAKFADPADVLAFVNKLESQRGAAHGGKLPPVDKETKPFERRAGEAVGDYMKRIDAQIASRK